MTAKAERTWGGKRAGAGRPAGEPRKKYTVALSERQVEYVAALAARDGLAPTVVLRRLMVSGGLPD